TKCTRSNIANNSTFTLPPTSLFQAYRPNIIGRLQLSQTGYAMPTAEYAKGVVEAALRNGGAPRTLAIGAHTSLFRMLRWIPKWVVLWYLWRRMGRLQKQ
ncbi:hypothetical protein RSAG8_10541, partial [Rhizoctonia solani AG-8 WAC10335]